MVATLAEATELATRGDWDACLSKLLAVWRTARDPELARLIERVSPRVSAPAVTGGGSVSRTLTKRIETAADCDVGPILACALTQVRTVPGAYGYVVALADERPADPRIATALASLIEHSPWAGIHGALQADVVEALSAIDDPRYRRLIIDAAAELGPQRARIRKRRRDLDTLVKLAATIEKRKPPKPLAGAPAAIAAIDRALAGAARAKKHASKTTDDLYAAVYSDPTDTSLRLVLADALQEKGDPRGELIALQCARADDAPPSRREKQLLKAHDREWLGPIEPVVLKDGLVYRRGFLACARLAWKGRTVAHDKAAIWSTIEEIDAADRGRNARHLLDPRWKALRRVYGVYAGADNDDLEAIARCKRELPWTAFGPRHPDRDTWAMIDPVMPELVEVDLAGGGDPRHGLRSLAKSNLVKRLRRVRAQTYRIPVPDLVAAARDTGITTLELIYDYTFPGKPTGTVFEIAGDALTIRTHDAKLDTRHLTHVVGSLAPKSVSSITVAPVALDEPTRKELERLTTVLGAELVTSARGT